MDICCAHVPRAMVTIIAAVAGDFQFCEAVVFAWCRFFGVPPILVCAMHSSTYLVTICESCMQTMRVRSRTCDPHHFSSSWLRCLAKRTETMHAQQQTRMCNFVFIKYYSINRQWDAHTRPPEIGGEHTCHANTNTHTQTLVHSYLYCSPLCSLSFSVCLERHEW